jgi:hypothetical protein
LKVYVVGVVGAGVPPLQPAIPKATIVKAAHSKEAMRLRLRRVAGNRKRKHPKKAVASKMFWRFLKGGAELELTTEAVAIVNVTVPGVELETVTLAGLKLHVAPVGRLPQVKATLPLKPF